MSNGLSGEPYSGPTIVVVEVGDTPESVDFKAKRVAENILRSKDELVAALTELDGFVGTADQIRSITNWGRTHSYDMLKRFGKEWSTALTGKMQPVIGYIAPVEKFGRLNPGHYRLLEPYLSEAVAARESGDISNFIRMRLQPLNKVMSIGAFICLLQEWEDSTHETFLQEVRELPRWIATYAYYRTQPEYKGLSPAEIMEKLQHIRETLQSLLFGLEEIMVGHFLAEFRGDEQNERLPVNRLFVNEIEQEYMWPVVKLIAERFYNEYKPES